MPKESTDAFSDLVYLPPERNSACSGFTALVNSDKLMVLGMFQVQAMPHNAIHGDAYGALLV